MKQLLNQLQNQRKYIKSLIIPLLGILLASGIIAAPANAINVYQMPNISAGEPTWVIDKSEVLSRFTEGKLNQSLEDLAKATGNQVRLVTVHGLDYGETAATFAQGLFEKWYGNPEDQANQTLIVLDTVTNNSAIVTGNSVKEIMSDDIAESVASETLQVPLRDGNKYNQAFLDVSDRIVAVLSGEPDPGAPVLEEDINIAGNFKSAEETQESNATLWVVVILVVATVIPMVTYFFYQGFS